PLIAVFWHNRDSASRTTELTSALDLSETICGEFWPWLDANFSISRDPKHRVISGFSLGGLASLCVGLDRPDIFGSVLAVSPSLWFSPDGANEPSGWLNRQYALSPRPLPTVFLSV